MIVYQHRVRYHETDTQAFMFNARYLEMADVAMTEYFRAIGHPYPDLLDEGLDPSVVKAEITFSRPARFDDLLDVDVTCVSVGRSSFTLRFAMSRDGEPINEVLLVYVNVDTDAEKSRPLPESIGAALRGLAKPASEPSAADSGK
ncbi:acyl-CoA thioesterase [Gordonia neofelifaecis]|uniref:Thioesterase superfamily protein n=1 Tax=Gordonia neofelifaecis NRRL B-59395 TaxID=644548 RepID=F1YMF4_9ACTN|nr:thioesterase family protein [Gordonia neofelifaecis]EGD54079.1 thioesterase superfamily protein [Gordonia neofelifaecis NRRL B-59395]